MEGVLIMSDGKKIRFICPKDNFLKHVQEDTTIIQRDIINATNKYDGQMMIEYTNDKLWKQDFYSLLHINKENFIGLYKHFKTGHIYEVLEILLNITKPNHMKHYVKYVRKDEMLTHESGQQKYFSRIINEYQDKFEKIN